ncbi:MAG: cytochrome c oxidase subunit II transmembrane domain-containing protein [Planctomycetota bacterium]
MNRLWDSLFGSAGQLPPKLSTTAAEVDWLYDYIYWWCVFFFVLIVAVMGYFMWRYRRRPGHGAQPSPSHHLGIELVWSVIPTILIIPIFYWGFTGYMDLHQAPADCVKVEAEASQWQWKFRYANGATMGNKQSEDSPYFGLHVAPGRNVQIILSSNDVLHSFYIPNFRVKQDVVPGRYTSVWFNAPFVDPASPDFEAWPPGAPTEFETKNGKYKVNAHRLFCTEYCGTSHSTMDSWVFVHESQEKLEEALQGGQRPLGQGHAGRGRRRAPTKNCASCHAKHSRRSRPPCSGASRRTGASRSPGSRTAPQVQVTVGREYVLQSIRDPGSQLALQDLSNPGNPWANNMQKGLYPTLENEVYRGDEEKFKGKNGLDAIVAFIQSLNQKRDGE